MLTFITWWRAAAIVLNDLGSSAFYAGSTAEQAVGKAAPWFIIGVMLFSFAVRAVYVESCSMFVRGGVYRVVKEALGGTLAKISVSALMFDYVLTGPISGVSAGQYVAGLVNEVFSSLELRHLLPHPFGWSPHLDENSTAVVIAIVVTLYYWWENTKGIEESSDKALKVIKITTVMVVILLGWSIVTLIQHPRPLPPLPFPGNLNFNEGSLGFLRSHPDLPKLFGVFGIMMAFGHSILAMSGEESLAQVFREIGHPKLKNLKKTALLIAVYSFLFTGLSSLFAVMLVPDDVRSRPEVINNVLGSMVMYFSGPRILRLAFRAFVVVVGFLMLSGAVNTAIVGSNGVLNRVSEDGVLTDWFRRPHPRFGTSSRIINMVVLLQLFTILLSRGDVYLLGEAYAFGVIWSFVFNSLSMLVLRFKYKGERGWKVPLNLTIAGIEIPVGLASVHLVLISTAIVNLFTKSTATKAGIVFTIAFFALFAVSERINLRKFATAEKQMKEHFQLDHQETVGLAQTDIRPGNILVSVRDYNTLDQLNWVLHRTDTQDQDVVVLTASLQGPGSAETDVRMDQIFSEHVQLLFTKVVAHAETHGKRLALLVVPARDVWSAIVQTANSLQSVAVVAGESSKLTVQEQAHYLGRAWEAQPDPKRQFVFHIVRKDQSVFTVRVGPHTPELRPEDIALIHRIWLDVTKDDEEGQIHHSDIVTVALTRLARDYGRDKDEVLKQLLKGSLLDKRFGPQPPAALPVPYGTTTITSPAAEKRRLEKLREQEKAKEKEKDSGPPVLGP
jgi:amino acid transporter